MNNPTFEPPSPCVVAQSFGIELVAHSPAYSWDAELFPAPGQDERKRSTRDVPSGMGGTLDRRLRSFKLAVGVAIDWVSCRSSTVLILSYYDGLMYSQASVIPGNAGGSTACVIKRSEKLLLGSTGRYWLFLSQG